MVFLSKFLWIKERNTARVTEYFKEKKKKSCMIFAGLLFGVADGARTHDNWNHNPGLYQLSYSHRKNWHARQESNL